MNDDLSVNFDLVETQAKMVVDQKVTGVFVCGTTGESLTLTVDERKKVRPLRLFLRSFSSSLISGSSTVTPTTSASSSTSVMKSSRMLRPSASTPMYFYFQFVIKSL